MILNAESETTSDGLSSMVDEKKEYYVHFTGCTYTGWIDKCYTDWRTDAAGDKRLDEWIAIDRFILHSQTSWADKPGSVTRVNKHAEHELSHARYTRESRSDGDNYYRDGDEEDNEDGSNNSNDGVDDDYIDVERVGYG